MSNYTPHKMMYLFMHILKTRAWSAAQRISHMEMWLGILKILFQIPLTHQLHRLYTEGLMAQATTAKPQTKKCDVFAQWTHHEVCGGGKIPKPKSEWCIYCANVIHRCGFVFYPTLYYTMWRYWHFWKPYDFLHEQMISKNASARSLVVMVTPKLLLVAP